MTIFMPGFDGRKSGHDKICEFFGCDFEKILAKSPKKVGKSPVSSTKVATKNLGKSRVCGVSAHFPTFFLN